MITGGNGGVGGVATYGTSTSPASSSAPGVYVAPSSTSTITNTGTITGGSGSYGIQNDGTISALNNSQANLTYSGSLPTNYSIIIDNTLTYGKLTATSVTGTMTFGISSLSTPSYSLLNHTFTSVLTGITSANLGLGALTTVSSISNGYSYTLSETTSTSNIWDLLLTACSGCNPPAPPPPPEISTGSTTTISGLSSHTPVLSGGTLVLNKGDSTSTALTVASAGGIIQHPTTDSATLSGALTGSGGLTFTGTGTTVLTGANTYTGGTTVASGTLQGNTSSLQGNVTNNGTVVFDQSTPGTFSGTITGTGKLVTQNTGTLVLTGNNAYTGGTQVNAGSNLSISSGSALGTGQLDLVGSGTTPATLTITADTTISNNISVSGDPTFNVSSGATMTVSGEIVDGVSADDVVVQGGGTLKLTAVDTYTGPTIVSNGSSLALSGVGSIANSSVANSGTFNIQNVARNVSVAGFSQASSGLLTMNFASVDNQKLNVSGTTSLAGSLSLAAAAGRYVPSHYTLLTSTGLLTGHFSNVAIDSLANYTNLGYSLSYDAHDVYLNLLPNLLNTQASLQTNVAALQGVYALQTGTINNSLNYDCGNFGSQGFCVSTGGRYSNASESSANTTSAMVIAGYRINDHLRIGGSLDQNLYNTDVAQTAMVSSNTPLLGAFVVWNQNADRTGFEAKAATSYNNSDVTINRSPIGSSELGKGSSALNTLAESLTASYGVKLGENWMTSPYAVIRHTSVASSAYTERASANLTVPLSYNGVYQDSTTALLGVKFAGLVYKNTTIQASAGYEQDLQNSVNNYTATGLDGLTSITFNPNIQRSRAVASFGANYEVAKGDNIGFNTIYRQESFQNVDTKMAYVNYTLGF